MVVIVFPICVRSPFLIREQKKILKFPLSHRKTQNVNSQCVDAYRKYTQFEYNIILCIHSDAIAHHSLGWHCTVPISPKNAPAMFRIGLHVCARLWMETTFFDCIISAFDTYRSEWTRRVTKRKKNHTEIQADLLWSELDENKKK